MEKAIYDKHGWKAVYELDEDTADRVWVYRRGEILGTFEAVEEQMPEELVAAVESFYESL